MSKRLILVTGGARAGKSGFALRLAQGLSLPAEPGSTPVLFVATAEAGDAEMEERIREHRSSRPAEWSTLEEPIHLSEAVSTALSEPGTRDAGVVVVDCLNLWVSNMLLAGQDSERAAIEEGVLDSARRLLECYQQGTASFVLVSNEVGLGLVPSHPLGRHFRDLLGKVNQLVAAEADEVYLLVAGLPLELKALSGQVVDPDADDC
ncbi:MAG: bifunctional adenosylcobinamide kinase/adenosylcobinamide-phosphate guanylyltransferase [Chloroflexi bacterium]|nr:bifunctional adenosylcobinamide kinase/adenosylcobinamide-phosphate guanylyltransferase [Chloroflexota bacterium]